MPNILICGYGDNKANKLKELIDGLMQEIGFQDDAITSIIDVKSESCDGRKRRRPYLWIRSEDKAEIEIIIEKFKEASLRQDVEWEVIGGFIPSDEMWPPDPPQVEFDYSSLYCIHEGPGSKCNPSERPNGFCTGCGG